MPRISSTSESGAQNDAALHSDPAHDQGPALARPTAEPDRHPGSVPIRTCVGCRTRSSADGLLRVVAAHGVLTPDPRRRLPGRGAWLHPALECLDRAERRSAFPRALRVPGPLDTTAVRTQLNEAVPRAAASTISGPNSEGGARETPGPVRGESKVDPS